MTNLTCVNANEVGIVINNCRWWGPYWIRSPTEEGKMKKILEFRQSRVGERSSNDTSPNITVVHHNLRWSFFLLMIIIKNIRTVGWNRSFIPPDEIRKCSIKLPLKYFFFLPAIHCLFKRLLLCESSSNQTMTWSQYWYYFITSWFFRHYWVCCDVSPPPCGVVPPPDCHARIYGTITEFTLNLPINCRIWGI